jgi:hypothetical protein
MRAREPADLPAQAEGTMRPEDRRAIRRGCLLPGPLEVPGPAFQGDGLPQEAADLAAVAATTVLRI